MMCNPLFSSEILRLETSLVSMILGVSGATLNLLGSQPRGSPFLNLPGLVLGSSIELEIDQPRVWTESGNIFICYILCLASAHFLQGRPLA